MSSYNFEEKKITAPETEVDEILCSDLLGLEKPANELFEWFESKLAMTGRDLMYVGDNPRKDFYGANLRSWTSVRVMTGENHNIKCKSAFKASLPIPSVIDLETLLPSKRRF